MVSKWKNSEVDFLINAYPIHGASYCAKILNKTLISIKSMVGKIGVRKAENERYNKDSFSKVVSESKSYAEIVRVLGLTVSYGNRKTIKRYIKLYGLDISHFNFGASTFRNINKYTLEEVLIENSPMKNSTTLKRKLYRHGLKKDVCEECGHGNIWMGKKMSMILDHKNGINDDNRIENIRILCPNCNATTDTFCRGNLEKYKEYKEIKKSKCLGITKDKIVRHGTCSCGNKKDIKAKRCSSCYQKSPNVKVANRPDYNTLLSQVGEFGYSAVGRLYGVSDNAVRKWIQRYEKNMEQ